MSATKKNRIHMCKNYPRHVIGKQIRHTKNNMQIADCRVHLLKTTEHNHWVLAVINSVSAGKTHTTITHDMSGEANTAYYRTLSRRKILQVYAYVTCRSCNRTTWENRNVCWLCKSAWLLKCSSEVLGFAQHPLLLVTVTIRYQTM